jgi:hypothetical protein
MKMLSRISFASRRIKGLSFFLVACGETFKKRKVLVY